MLFRSRLTHQPIIDCGTAHQPIVDCGNAPHGFPVLANLQRYKVGLFVASILLFVTLTVPSVGVRTRVCPWAMPPPPPFWFVHCARRPLCFAFVCAFRRRVAGRRCGVRFASSVSVCLASSCHLLYASMCSRLPGVCLDRLHVLGCVVRRHLYP